MILRCLLHSLVITILVSVYSTYGTEYLDSQVPQVRMQGINDWMQAQMSYDCQLVVEGCNDVVDNIL